MQPYARCRRGVLFTLRARACRFGSDPEFAALTLPEIFATLARSNFGTYRSVAKAVYRSLDAREIVKVGRGAYMTAPFCVNDAAARAPSD